MANKDYDDLLRSFMNNSSKAYDEDRHAVEKQAQQAQQNLAAMAHISDTLQTAVQGMSSTQIGRAHV